MAVWVENSTLKLPAGGRPHSSFTVTPHINWRGNPTHFQVKFPSRETVFDYWLDPETGSFEQWTKSPYFFSIDYDSRVTPMTQVIHNLLASSRLLRAEGGPRPCLRLGYPAAGLVQYLKNHPLRFLTHVPYSCTQKGFFTRSKLEINSIVSTP